jgi:hypothetical protein
MPGLFFGEPFFEAQPFGLGGLAPRCRFLPASRSAPAWGCSDLGGVFLRPAACINFQAQALPFRPRFPLPAVSEKALPLGRQASSSAFIASTRLSRPPIFPISSPSRRSCSASSPLSVLSARRGFLCRPGRRLSPLSIRDRGALRLRNLRPYLSALSRAPSSPRRQLGVRVKPLQGPLLRLKLLPRPYVLSVNLPQPVCKPSSSPSRRIFQAPSARRAAEGIFGRLGFFFKGAS